MSWFDSSSVFFQLLPIPRSFGIPKYFHYRPEITRCFVALILEQHFLQFLLKSKTSHFTPPFFQLILIQCCCI